MKIKVRIAVAVAADGGWCACGGGGFDDDDNMSECHQAVGSGAASYWLEAELDAPTPPPVIQATVTPEKGGW